MAEEREADAPTVRTLTGPVKGFVNKTTKGDTYNYLGIPYARPPLGELRFEKPQPAIPWTETLEVTQFHPTSVPHHESAARHPFSEDSLYLNVMQPSTKPPPSGFPVLFIVHPSAHSIGSVHFIGGYRDLCENFVARGIVAVHFHYRLGFLSYSSTGDNVLPGNLGLWDMTMALTWTYHNISRFGGDPRNICAWGLSSGSICTNLLALSPHSRDMITKTICNSGSVYAGIAVSDEVVTDTFKLARAMGCSGTSTVEIKRRFKSATLEEFMVAREATGLCRDGGLLVYTPRVDGDFLPKDIPQLIAEREPIPTLTGFTRDEAIYLVLNNLPSLHTMEIYPKELEIYSRAHFEVRVRSWYITEAQYGELAPEIGDQVINFYLSQLPPNPKPIDMLNLQYKIYDHLQFLVPCVVEAVEKMSYGYPVYLYENTWYRDEHFESCDFCPLKGSMHIMEFKPFFGVPLPTNYTENEDDLKFKENLISTHVNFIKTGNPSTSTIHWPQVTARSPNLHLEMLPEVKLRDRFGHDKFLQFWLGLAKIYGDVIFRGRKCNHFFKRRLQAQRPRL